MDRLPLTCPHPGTWTATQACALTGNQSADLLVFRPMLNPLSHTSQGPIFVLMPDNEEEMWGFGPLGAPLIQTFPLHPNIAQGLCFVHTVFGQAGNSRPSRIPRGLTSRGTSIPLNLQLKRSTLGSIHLMSFLLVNLKKMLKYKFFQGP